MGIYQSCDDGSWSSARAEDMVFLTLKQWRKPDIQAHHHGLDLSAGSSMGAITRDGGLGWLCGVLRWRTWPLFSFLSLLLFLYYFVCVSDRDGLPNGFDYYLFSRLGPLMFWSRSPLGNVPTSTWHLALFPFSDTFWRGNGRERL